MKSNKKQVVRLTESELHRIVKKNVMGVLNENENLNPNANVRKMLSVLNYISSFLKKCDKEFSIPNWKEPQHSRDALKIDPQEEMTMYLKRVQEETKSLVYKLKTGHHDHRAKPNFIFKNLRNMF